MYTRKYLKKKNKSNKKYFTRRKNGGALNQYAVENLKDGIEELNQLPEKNYTKNFKKKFNEIIGNTAKKMENINKTSVKLLLKPDTSILYTKQGSTADTNYQTGDFVIEVKNKDANIYQFLKKKMKSVDSLLANLLNQCNDWTCISHKKPPLISKQEIIYTDNKDTWK